MSELKPCPFCGRAPQEVIDAAMVECRQCSMMLVADSPDEARAGWNRRATPQEGEVIEGWARLFIKGGEGSVWLHSPHDPAPGYNREAIKPAILTILPSPTE